MGDNKTVVDYLKKVTLELETGSRQADLHLTNNPLQVTFVFSKGWCLF